MSFYSIIPKSPQHLNWNDLYLIQKYHRSNEELWILAGLHPDALDVSQGFDGILHVFFNEEPDSPEENDISYDHYGLSNWRKNDLSVTSPPWFVRSTSSTWFSNGIQNACLYEEFSKSKLTSYPNMILSAVLDESPVQTDIMLPHWERHRHLATRYTSEPPPSCNICTMIFALCFEDFSMQQWVLFMRNVIKPWLSPINHGMTGVTKSPVEIGHFVILWTPGQWSLHLSFQLRFLVSVLMGSLLKL